MKNVESSKKSGDKFGLVDLKPQSSYKSQKKIYTNFLVFKSSSYLQNTCKAELSVCLKTGNSRCSTYVTVPYHVYKEIVELNGVVFKPKPKKIEDTKIRPKTRSQQYKISGNKSNVKIQKQQTKHQQHQSQYQQPAAQHLPILQSLHQQNSFLKSQHAMKQREQLKSKHQAQQIDKIQNFM